MFESNRLPSIIAQALFWIFAAVCVGWGAIQYLTGDAVGRAWGSWWFLLGIVAVSLHLALLALTFAVQGYAYTEPTEGVWWQAPLGAVVLTAFLAGWCWLNLSASGPDPNDIPYHTIFGFSGIATLTDRPVERIWVYRKGSSQPIEYRLHKYVEGGLPKYEYVQAGTERRWKPEGIESIEIEVGGKEKRKLRFVPRPDLSDDYRIFASDDGWTMPEYTSGVTGRPEAFRTSLFLANLLINGLHFVLWVMVLWLGLRFLFWHSVGLGAICWLILTLTLVPVLLRQIVAVRLAMAA